MVNCQDKNLPTFLKEIIRVLEKRKGVGYCAEKRNTKIRKLQRNWFQYSFFEV